MQQSSVSDTSEDTSVEKLDQDRSEGQSDPIIGDWAFVTLIAKYMESTIHTGTFGRLQELLRAKGFAVSVLNVEKQRKRLGKLDTKRGGTPRKGSLNGRS